MSLALVAAYLTVMIGTLAMTFVLLDQGLIERRAAAMTPVDGNADGQAWWEQVHVTVDGTEFTVIGLTGDIAEPPPGAEIVPGVGEAILSPGARQQLKDRGLPDDYFGRVAGEVRFDVLETPDLPLLYRGIENPSAEAIPFSGFGEEASSALLFGARPELEPKWEIATLYLTALVAPAVFFTIIVWSRVRAGSRAINRKMDRIGLSSREIFATSAAPAAVGVLIAGAIFWAMYGVFTVTGIRGGGYSVGAADFGNLGFEILIFWLLLAGVLIVSETFLIARRTRQRLNFRDGPSEGESATNPMLWLFILTTLGAWWIPLLLPMGLQFISYIVLQFFNLVFAAFVLIDLFQVVGRLMRSLGSTYHFPSLMLSGAGVESSATRIGVLSASLMVLCTYAAISVVWSNTSTALSEKSSSWRDTAVEKVAIGHVDIDDLSSIDFQGILSDDVTVVTVRTNDGADEPELVASASAWQHMSMPCAKRCEVQIDSPSVDPRIRSLMNWAYGGPTELIQVVGDPLSTPGATALVGDTAVSTMLISVNQALFNAGAPTGFFEIPDESAQAGLNVSRQTATWIETLTVVGVLLVFGALGISWWVESSGAMRVAAQPGAVFGRRNLSCIAGMFYAGVPIVATGVLSVFYSALLPSRLSELLESPMPRPAFYLVVIGAMILCVVVLSIAAWFYGRRQTLDWQPSRAEVDV